MVTVGRVVRPHGNKGHVVIAPETDFPEARFEVGAVVHILRDGSPVPIAIVASREHDGRWIVGLEGVGTIDAAEAFRGQELRIPPEAIQPLAPGGYYVHDLRGCEVELVSGSHLGRVERVEFGSGTPLLVVATASGEVLVPLAETVCRRIDVEHKRIVIDPPEGLIELNE